MMIENSLNPKGRHFIVSMLSIVTFAKSDNAGAAKLIT